MYLFNKKFQKSLILSSCLLFGSAFASDGTEFFPTTPGFSFTGLTGSNTTGSADALIPLFGQSATPLYEHSESFFYIDPQGLYHSSEDYSASLGLGQRWLVDNANIFGAYVFADYNHSPSGHGFWFVSPGVERLGDTIDFSANLYVPIGDKTVTADTFDQVFFQGNNQYTQNYQLTESVGMGGDIEIGYRLPLRNNPKVYVGGYYASPENNKNITGGSVRVEIPLSERFSVLLSDSYDNVNNNTWKAGITYAFGGRHSSYSYKSGNLADRMLDPIHRNLASTSGGYSTNQPITQSTVPGEPQVLVSHISFFVPTGTTGVGTGNKGTYEDPYLGISQADITNANDQGNKLFYINSGTYNPTGTLTFQDNTVLGRQDVNGQHFVALASGSNRPLFVFPATIDGFVFSGSNTVDSLQLQAPVDTNTGVGMKFNSLNNQLNNTINDVAISGFQQGLAIYDTTGSTGTSNTMISNSTFSNAGYTQLGIASSTSTNTATMNVNVVNSMINSQSANANGIVDFNTGNGTLNINVTNSTINSSGANNGVGGIYTINSGGTSTVGINVQNSNISGWSNGTGILAYNPNAATQINLQVSNVAISNNGTGISLNNVSDPITKINALINGSQIINNVLALDASRSTVNVNNGSTIYGSGQDITSTQINASNGSTINVNAPNSFIGTVQASATPATVTLQGQDSGSSPIVVTNNASTQVRCTKGGACVVGS